MTKEEFQQQCLDFFRGNADFMGEGKKFLGDYSSARLLADGKVEVELHDFGGCFGIGDSVQAAYDRANSVRHLVAEEAGLRGTGYTD